MTVLLTLIMLNLRICSFTNPPWTCAVTTLPVRLPLSGEGVGGFRDVVEISGIFWKKAIFEISGIFRKNGPGFERSHCVFQIKSRGIYLPVRSNFGWYLGPSSESLAMREAVSRGRMLRQVVFFPMLWAKPVPLLAPRRFSGQSRFRLRLQQLRVWMDLLRPTARGAVLTLLRRPPFTDSLA